RLVERSYEATRAGIHAVRPCATLGDIGLAIQSVAHLDVFSVVREYCGDCIGRKYHEEREVLHYGSLGKGLMLKPGMVFT
ncbi:M24 family metallopeptidase, partial [Pseudomonas syringae pv. tagetis]|uniref:M24 family metallopeptidase n=1 Tax=Pseudomonas syringae group genomosp. 7 TaxID=251699 RepID=UPI00376FC367